MFNSLKYPPGALDDPTFTQGAALLEEWEVANPPPPGLSQIERFKRYFVDLQETRKNARKAAKLIDCVDTINRASSRPPTLSTRTTAAEQKEAYPTSSLLEYSETSKEAALMLQAKIYFSLSKVSMLGGDMDGAIQSMANAYRCSELVIAWTRPMLTTYCAECQTRLRLNPNDADASIVLGFVTGMQRQYPAAIRLLSNPAFERDVGICNLLGAILSFARDWRGAICAFDKVIELGDIRDVNVYEAYYKRAHGKMQLGDEDGAKQDFYQFIACCDGNERSLCQAYFQLAVVDFSVSAGELYKKGLDAKENRCPIFHRDATSNFETIAASLKSVSPAGPCGNPDCRSGGLKLCSGCGLTRYCSAVCQKKMWKSHKKDCQNALKSSKNSEK